MTESFRSGDAKRQLQQEQDVLREAMRKLAREILVALVVAVADANARGQEAAQQLVSTL